MRSSIQLFVLLVLLASPAWPEGRILLVPGERAGLIELGKPIPRQAYATYGQPSSRTEPGEEVDTGSVVFGESSDFHLSKGMLVKLNDGHERHNVFSVYVTGLRAYTPAGVYLGTRRAEVKARYPEAVEEEDALTGERNLRIPGMLFSFSDDDLVEMVVLPITKPTK
ncbi:MAG: hypothetical protein AB7S38_24475 [Vulcanimicrobiota bacterium]